jgi:hypothetical protein
MYVNIFSVYLLFIQFLNINFAILHIKIFEAFALNLVIENWRLK